CPSGFIKMSTQCFKIFLDRERSWPEAKTKCEQEGYILAQPDDSVAVDLRKKLYEEYRTDWAWLGARGDGSKFVYAHGGLALDNNSPLWFRGHPRNNVGAERCLLLMVDGGYLSYFINQPTQQYWSMPCSSSMYNYALCEAK
ncbi:unnamed protein product, partial [Meganyctiphanes norvegica]